MLASSLEITNAWLLPGIGTEFTCTLQKRGSQDFLVKVDITFRMKSRGTVDFLECPGPPFREAYGLLNHNLMNIISSPPPYL